ncbi:hypothetical protein QFC22_006310 [Naganishia vaughanmartiniae]|uniref:Uncharacterized protein n=1 Tax=Naganishia vaughanmartiniae TaxID=1424756 RepID=A0ACC2WN43_9TREE|nr:hypothetical protein QFC22_006310 [Naganishia vaughanmartiniae]
MVPTFVGLDAVGWDEMTSSWWGKALGGIALGGIVLVSLYVLYRMGKATVSFIRQRRAPQMTMSPAVKRHFQTLNAATYNKQDSARRHDTAQRIKTGPLKSFGVYLGDFADPPSAEQRALFSRWQGIVIDPFRTNALSAAATSVASSSSSSSSPSSSSKSTTRVLARLDIARLLDAEKAAGDDSDEDQQLVKSIDTVVRHVASLAHVETIKGVVFASWQANFCPAVCNQLVAHINGRLGMQVFLEVGPPDYLDPKECIEIDMHLIHGVIFRNGTIMRHNGDRRNYFQMESLRRGMRALAKVSFKGDTTIMMWELLNDGIDPSYAVLKRSYNWCRFHCAISWIGSQAALMDANKAAISEHTQRGEPLGAMMWLKSNKTVAAHEAWRLNDRVVPKRISEEEDTLAVYAPLEEYIPNVRTMLTPRSHYKEDDVHDTAVQDVPSPTVDAQFEWPTGVVESRTNPITCSPSGTVYTGLGCFPLGLNVSAEAFATLLAGQRRLRSLGLLDRLQPQELAEMADKLVIRDDDDDEDDACCRDIVRKLKQSLLQVPGEEQDRLEIYIGLHSGFRDGLATQFWGLYHVDPTRSCTELYINAKSADRLGTILHTYLSSNNVPRGTCFLAEYQQSEHAGQLADKWSIPNRLVRDIEQLTPAENLLFLRRFVRTNELDPDFASMRARIVACCEYQLLEVPTLAHYRALNSSTYLEGGISATQLVQSRLSWHAQNGFDHPDVLDATSLFTDVDARLSTLLKQQHNGFLTCLEDVFAAILNKGNIDVSADIFALAVFCAFRRLALDEVYLEVLDRNPLPNPHPDQAACFAEMFALGSQCQAYFDMTSNVLGTILANRYHAYYMENQPPPRQDGITDLPTAYFSTQVDLDPKPEKPSMSAYYRITFLAIFAVPALIDVLLLTTIGRGLYLTTYMASDEKSMATAALMTSLLLCGAFSTWIGTGATYYLNAMAFSALNMFVLTRWIAGLAVTLLVGVVSLIVIGLVKGFYAGLIFFLYLICLSTYLISLGALSNYQYPGFAFHSGRTVIITCVPILFLSPILTLWIGHDIVVYLCVMYGFLTALLLGMRRTVSQWGSWYLDIPFVSDTEIVTWYKTKQESAQVINDMSQGTDLAATPFPRILLTAAVLEEYNRKPWTRRTDDDFVEKLSTGHEATVLLMDWYSQFSNTAMPYMFSPTWNLQCKAATDTLKDMQKGLKLHNAFLHWRHASDEVWCGFLYFVIALMDKWVFLVSGGSFVGLSHVDNTVFRLAVGFGLAYYLLAAICLDSVAQPLWVLAQKRINQPITSLERLHEAAINDASARRKLYWIYFVKFFLLHAWGLAVVAALMWTFEGSRDGVIMFLAYIGAYSGLLFYQYNRIFAGTRALKNLATAALIGLIGGPILVRTRPEFAYGGVSTLTIATWSTALLSFWTADIGRPRWKDVKAEIVLGNKSMKYESSAIQPYCDYTQTQLSKMFESTATLQLGPLYRVPPTVYPGTEVANAIAVGAETAPTGLLSDAFPNAKFLLDESLRLWRSGEVIVDVVPQHQLLPSERGRVRVITQDDGNLLRIIIFVHVESSASHPPMNTVLRFSNVIAEAILQFTASSRLNLSRSDSNLVPTLLRPQAGQQITIPNGIKQHLEWYPIECKRTAEREHEELLRHILLGLDADREWDQSPKHIRRTLLDRWIGKAVKLTLEDLLWLSKRLGQEDIFIRLSRSTIGATLAILVGSYARALLDDQIQNKCPSLPSVCVHEGAWTLDQIAEAKHQNSHFLSNCLDRCRRVHYGLRFAVKFLVISTVADGEYQRELDYVLTGKVFLVRWSAKSILGGMWMYCKVLQRVILPVFLLHNREPVQTLYKYMYGVKTVIKGKRVVIESLDGPLTGFLTALPDESVKLSVYQGRYKRFPSEEQEAEAINTYGRCLDLRQRREYIGTQLVNIYIYEYDKSFSPTIPVTRMCKQGESAGQTLHYDSNGHIISGAYRTLLGPVQFTLSYRKNAKYVDNLLRGHFVWPHIAITVEWCVAHPEHPEVQEMSLPYTKVTAATFVQEADVWRCIWSYDHRSHPDIKTTLNGTYVETPVMVLQDLFGVLKKPDYRGFAADNPLCGFASFRTNLLSRMLGQNVRWTRISTSSARTHLWKSWKNDKNLDAVTSRWLDELALRSDGVLKPYWRARDTCRLVSAAKYLDTYSDAILARTDVEPDISAWSSITYKISDLYSFGQGGDTRINTRTLSTQMQDSRDNLHVLAMDTGTWPNEGGGVSACRRDVVNDLKSIRWHVIAESANDYGTPKFQIEKNIQSLTVLPLWGLDFLTPTHGVFMDSLDSAIQIRSQNTNNLDIERNFLPILTTLVRCSRAIKFDSGHIRDATRALVELNSYFEADRHWSEVWSSEVVKARWRLLWLTNDMENATPVSQWLDSERPTLLHLDNALDLWSRFLFIFSVPVPDKIPDVFQASHHATGASYGVLCKIKRNCTFHVWDHPISWRETTVYLSSAMSFDSPFVCTSLMSLARMASVLILHHADVVLPCADFFNPGWEVELGTQGGTVQHRRSYARKIDPVVNGICNMDNFKPIEKIKTTKPTVAMLSHVRFIKDTKNAILAADIIVNEWGFTDYKLEIYGDMEKAPANSVECKEILASKSLRDFVTLRGVGNASKVLEEAWVFLNSSISEGLPLAMGEAALSGVPVVCTDVGASFRVVTDPVTWKRFSAVVGPNDAYSLARAQINVLGLLDEWSEYAEDDEPGSCPKLSFRPTIEEVALITKRMYDKTEQRRRLGMLGRKNILSSFSGDRYLREHEQMLWVGKLLSPSHRARVARLESPSQSSAGIVSTPEYNAPSCSYTPPGYVSDETPDLSEKCIDFDQHPHVQFVVIVNPNSGPGVHPEPDTRYAHEIPRLNARANVQTVGYVSTNYCKRDVGDVVKDIRVYSGWSSMKGMKGVSVQGIFFDETPNHWSAEAAEYLDMITAEVKKDTGIKGDRMVIHNPGTTPDASIANQKPDITAVFEDAYSRYRSQSKEDRISAGLYDRAASLFIVHSTPLGEIKRLVNELRSRVGYLFVTDLQERYYESFGPGWTSFVKAVVADPVVDTAQSIGQQSGCTSAE